MHKTIGIVGGGQLGRMLSEAAIALGLEVIVIDPTPDCPAKQVGAEQIVAGYKDVRALKTLAEKSDYITIEFEHINAAALEEIALSKPVNPAPSTIRMIQDKYGQKVFLKRNNLAVADFVEIKSLDEAEKAFDKWKGRMIIKSKTESFDGRGNAAINNRQQLAAALKKFEGKEVYGEEIIGFEKELAVMVAKDFSGNTLCYPVVETVHQRNICVEVYAPAAVNGGIAEKAQKTAEEAVSKLEGAGLYGVEMFLTENDEILINEIAPRVHNSGHYTMAMYDPSQFTQHVLAITDGKLKLPQPKAKYCCMINILGERDGPVELSGIEQAQKIPGVSVYIYGKSPTRIDRKMGHINALAGTMEEAKANARAAIKLIGI